MTDYYGRSLAEDEIARQIPINKGLKQLLDDWYARTPDTHPNIVGREYAPSRWQRFVSWIRGIV